MSRSARGTLSLRLYYVMSCGIGGVYLPLFPRWLEARGMVGVRLGFIAAAAPAVNVVAPAAFGALADALGVRGGLLQFACAGALVTLGALTAAAAAGISLGFGVLLLAAVTFALFRAPMGFIADVVAVELAPVAGTTYGRLRLWGSLGFIAAVPLGARFVDPRGAAAFPAFTACVVLAALLASLRLPPRYDLRERRPRLRPGSLLRDGDFVRFLAAVFLGQCGQAAYDLCFSFRLFDLGVQPRSFTFALAWDIGTAAEVLLMACSGPLLRACSPAGLLVFALGCSAVRWGAVAWAPSAMVLLGLQPLHAVTWALGWLASVAYTSRRFPANSLATVQGLFTTAVGAGSVVGMLAWGSLYQRVGGAAVFAGAACFSACACALALALRRSSPTPHRAGAEV